MSTAATGLGLEPERANSLADDVEAQAAVDLYAAAPRELELRTEVLAGATLLLAPRIPASFFNRVIGLGGHEPATGTDVGAVLDIYRTAAISDYWLHVTPTARPPALGEWLVEAGLGFPPRRSWAKFLRSTQSPAAAAPPGITVRHARADEADAVAGIACAAFGLPTLLAGWFASLVGRPGWTVLVAELEGRLIATGSLFVSGTTGWLGIGATLAEFRQRGAQSALLAARVRAAAEQGCEIVATETGESIAGEPNPSLGNIRRAGFVQVCSRLNYAARI